VKNLNPAKEEIALDASIMLPTLLELPPHAALPTPLPTRPFLSVLRRTWSKVSISNKEYDVLLDVKEYYRDCLTVSPAQQVN